MGPLAAELAPSFTVITYDRRGRGASTDTPPYAVEREVEDLQALVEAVGGSAFAYGFSSGAALLLHAALARIAFPRLALLEPPLALEDELDGSDLGAEVAELVAVGRRGDAVEHFNIQDQLRLGPLHTGQVRRPEAGPCTPGEPLPKVTLLQRFMGERLECRNISRNSLHRVLQRAQGLGQVGRLQSKRSAAKHLGFSHSSRIRSISSRKRTSPSLASPIAASLAHRIQAQVEAFEPAYEDLRSGK
jgi:pimeloyl-ACP methyl ester carboxylesterase